MRDGISKKVFMCSDRVTFRFSLVKFSFCFVLSSTELYERHLQIRVLSSEHARLGDVLS